jgi:hypothetical protein
MLRPMRISARRALSRGVYLAGRGRAAGGCEEVRGELTHAHPDRTGAAARGPRPPPGRPGCACGYTSVTPPRSPGGARAANRPLADVPGRPRAVTLPGQDHVQVVLRPFRRPRAAPVVGRRQPQVGALVQQRRPDPTGARSANRPLCSASRIACRSAGTSARGWSRSVCGTGACLAGGGLIRWRRYQNIERRS